MQNKYIFILTSALLFNLFLTNTGRCEDFNATALCNKYLPAIESVEKWLDGNPPLVPGDTVREKTLKLLDPVLTEKDAKMLPCVRDYFFSRMAAFKKDYGQHKVKEGISIWKLYNHTAIIKTNDATIAIDLYPGAGILKFTQEELNELAEGIDVLLITHVHGDHTVPDMAKLFLSKGKKVVGPKGMWHANGDGAGMMAGYPDAELIQDELSNMDSGEFKVNGTTVRVFGSWQKQDRNNVYMITSMDGASVMHTGDLNVLLFQPHAIWFKKLKEDIYVDAIIPNCWSPDLAALFARVHPSFIIASHEHELGHPVDGRRSFDYVYKTLSGYRKPFVVPAWGERIDIDSKANN